MFEEVDRKWGVRSRRVNGPGELILPARDQDDAHHASELMTRGDKVVEVVSHPVGEWQTEEERQAHAASEEEPVKVYLPEIIFFVDDAIPSWAKIESVERHGAFKSLAGALDQLQRRGIFRPDNKLEATLEKDGDVEVYWVHPADIPYTGMKRRHGLVMTIRVEVLQP